MQHPLSIPFRERNVRIFILHFACSPLRDSGMAEKWTADSCVLAPNLAQAEADARDLISRHHYQAGELIAYSELDEKQIASLSELESTLYLKAQVVTEKCAVMFSQAM